MLRSQHGRRPLLLLATTACLLPSARALERLRVMTWNVHAWRDSDHRDNFDGVVETCQGERPDILCLNEVLHPYNIEAQTDGYLAAVKDGAGVGLDVRPCAVADSYLHRLAAALGMPHVAFVEAERAKCFFGAAPFGNAVLSRRPFVDAGHLVLAAEPGDVRLGGQRRDDVESRGVVWAAVEVGDERVGFAAAHLDHKAEELREKQIGRCLDHVNAHCPALHLVCGDLNTFRRADHSDAAWDAIVAFYASRGWPRPAERSLALDACEARGYADAGAGAAPDVTCWTHNPLFRIDHVLLNDGLRRACDVENYRRVESAASDHFPVAFDLALRD
jgi:endonuclease/exonuclease/phosphatase family metal-dependent hydrolase